MVRSECLWALTNALCKATPQLTQAIVELGIFTAMNYAMELPDSRLVFVALDGVEYALKSGMHLPLIEGDNPFVIQIEKCGLLDKIEEMQNHENQ